MNLMNIKIDILPVRESLKNVKKVSKQIAKERRNNKISDTAKLHGKAFVNFIGKGMKQNKKKPSNFSTNKSTMAKGLGGIKGMTVNKVPPGRLDTESEKKFAELNAKLDGTIALLQELNFCYDVDTEELKYGGKDGKDIWVEGYLGRIMNTNKFSGIEHSQPSCFSYSDLSSLVGSGKEKDPKK